MLSKGFLGHRNTLGDSGLVAYLSVDHEQVTTDQVYLEEPWTGDLISRKTPPYSKVGSSLHLDINLKAWTGLRLSISITTTSLAVHDDEPSDYISKFSPEEGWNIWHGTSTCVIYRTTSAPQAACFSLGLFVWSTSIMIRSNELCGCHEMPHRYLTWYFNLTWTLH
jgi:hypothetical protein